MTRVTDIISLIGLGKKEVGRNEMRLWKARDPKTFARFIKIKRDLCGKTPIRVSIQSGIPLPTLQDIEDAIFIRITELQISGLCIALHTDYNTVKEFLEHA